MVYDKLHRHGVLAGKFTKLIREEKQKSILNYRYFNNTFIKKIIIKCYVIVFCNMGKMKNKAFLL